MGEAVASLSVECHWLPKDVWDMEWEDFQAVLNALDNRVKASKQP